MEKNKYKWDPTCGRFVAFLDIMGFKDRVFRNSHKKVLAEMELFHSDVIKVIEEDAKLVSKKPKGVWFLFGDTRIQPVLFSDSILLISSDGSGESAANMLFTVKELLRRSLEKEIPIKGAIAYGKQTADFDKSLYFGRPLIDAYELQNELQIYGVALHHTTEKRLAIVKTLIKHEENGDICKYQAPLKNGTVNHYMLDWLGDRAKNTVETLLSKLYLTVSGSPRIYVDNTLCFAQRNNKKINKRI